MAPVNEKRLWVICKIMWIIMNTSPCMQIVNTQTVSFALRKPCNMSTTYTDDNYNNSCAAAINGNTDTTYRNGNCIHTGTGDRAPYWNVNLEGTYSITEIVIFARAVEEKRMRNVTVSVDNTVVYIFPNSTTSIQLETRISQSNNPRLPRSGQLVTLARRLQAPDEGNSVFLNICEVQVFVNLALNKPCNLSSGFYFDGYTNNCTAANNGNISTVYGRGNCIHTNAGDQNPHWTVNLGNSVDIVQIVVFARGNELQRMNNLTVSVDNILVYTFPTTGLIQVETRINHSNSQYIPVSGQLVTLARQFQTKDETLFINVCEVQVWVPGIDECAANPCQNGGSCRNQIDRYFCTCAAGYTGLNCETNINECLSHPCQHGGTCKDQVNGYTCTCEAGYTGLNCEININECLSHPCQYGGTCHDEVNRYTCTCVAGYTGDNCQTDFKECSSNPCLHNGTCHDHVNSYSCTCLAGYTGDTCQTDIDECSSNPCLHNGTCHDHVNLYNCTCLAGYTGDTCQTDINECSSNLCQHNGTCLDQVNGYNCTCARGYIGQNCETDCPDGSYGYSCNGTCGQCTNVTTCNKTTGHCSACQPGWLTPLCTEECEDGHYGLHCQERCGNCSNHSLTCEPVTGQCPPGGCEGGFVGDNCKLAQTSSDNSNAAGIGAGVAVAVAVTLVVVIVAVLLIRRRRKMKEANANGQKIDSSELSQHVSLSPVSGDKGTKPKAAIKPQVKHLDRQDQTAETHIYGNLSSNGQELDITVADSVYCNIQNSRNDVTSSSPSQDSANNVTRTAKTPDNKPRKPPVAAKPNAVVYENVQPRVKEASQSKSHDEENLALPVEDVPDEDSVYNHEDLYACYSSVSSTESLMDSFQKYLLDCLASSGKLQEEFTKFPSGMPHPHDIGSQPANSGKNRFKKLCAYDKNRVILKRPKGDTNTDYINASYIQGFQIEKAYIATQGPRAHTVPDLWWMIWQEKSSQIIMLTNLKEDGKDKCNEYWPAVGKASVYGHVTVTSQREDTRADFVVRTFILDVKEGTSKPREVQQYHYTAWPDHGVPAAGSLVNYWRYVTARASGTAPPVIHCSAGVGRTGTYIALDIAVDRKSRGLDVSVHGIVSDLREQRSIMVQTEVQYRFLHEVILEAYSSRDTRITVSQLDSRLPTDIDVNKANEVIDKEFKMLSEMKQWAKPHHTTAKLEENRAKNRDTSVLPDDDHMAYLGIYVRGRNQYINAVFMSSFMLRNGLLLTQLPLPDTAVDLWRLVEGCNVKTIVSLGSKEDSNNIKNYCQYWPQTISGKLNFGPYSISLQLAKTDGDSLDSYDLTVQCKGKTHSVRVLHYTDWAGHLPNNTAYLLHLLDTLKTLTEKDTSPIIIQCVDGTTRSGLFCVLFDVMNRMTHDEDVDVFTAVRDVHSVRPQAVRTETEYRYCYKLAQEVRQRKLYANS